MVRQLKAACVVVFLGAAGAALAIDVTRPFDAIVPSSPNSPVGEEVFNAIDNTARTKYLNFDEINTGFTVTPSGPGIVRHLAIITANDAPARDPTSFTLEGSDDGIVFTLIASGILTPSTTRFAITSTPFSNNTTYLQYRVTFPTVRDPGGANSMQVAEVQLATGADVTSADDAVTIVYPPGGSSPPGEGPTNLFDDRLGTKLNVVNATGGPTTVDVTPLAGASVVTGLAYFSAADDLGFPGRTPQNITLLGSNDGISYTQIFTTPLVQAGDNFQDQEFEFANAATYTRYRLILDVPHFATDMQVGDIQLFGIATAAPPVNDACANATIVTPGEVSGTTNLATGTDITPCGSSDSIDVWYRYTAAASGLTEASTCDSTTDTTVAVYSGCAGTLLACDDNGCYLQSIARWDAVAGQTYLIRVALNGDATGAFRLLIDDAPEVHADTTIRLAYNFNGMVHAGESGMPDAPNGYRSISDRGLVIENSGDSITAGTTLGLSRIPYNLVRTAGSLDIVHLGDRNLVDNGNWAFDLVPDADNIGVQPDWLPSTDQTGPQTTSVLCRNIVMAAQTRIGVLYQASNGGGFFNMSLLFDDNSSVTVTLEAPDWFFDQSPGPPFLGVEQQAQLGVFTGAENTDIGQTGASLNVVEAIVSVPDLIADGFGDVTGRRLSSITFSDRTSLVAGYAIVAATVRDPVPRCPADFNSDGLTNSQDYFDFLTAFFSSTPCADFNDDGLINSQDYFDFLTAFFTGC